MWHLAPLIAWAVALALPLILLLLKLAGRRLRPLGQATMQAWAAQSGLAEQNLELLPVLKAFATDALEARRYREGAHRLAEAQLRQVRWQGAILPLVQIAGAGLVLALLGLAGRQILAGQLQVGGLVSVFLYGLVLVNPLSQLASVYGQAQTARGAAQRLLEVMRTAPEADVGDVDAIPKGGDLVFDRVAFAYPGRPPLFTDVSLRIRAGETLAITGPNGAGKSTLAHLLLRLHEPQRGQIRIGGIPLARFRLSALRGGIGLVSQQVLLWHASIRDNIAYGRADADQAAIERAARAARAHDFIQALPQGYDTVIGDQGVRLSGGQRQRIALARALLKDPPILILDEATAMFDPAGEAEFIAECHAVLRERTVLLITHRPASLALADRVIRLVDGRWEKIGDAHHDHAESD
ncbi:ABC transporter ATP-binding protein [Thermomonas sp. S9]|uniref:ABC transporter ATP-binding protein n=1 Tax=Thermomonas sp. S9 TaxID=2885203 RepID=UPI00216AE29E|nr:ABC transporter ATP-binding protein [Thermomonas sp. S9]